MRKLWQSPLFNADGGSGGGSGGDGAAGAGGDAGTGAGGAGAGAAATAPAGFEAFWDAEKNALKFDELGGVLKEHGDLKTFKTEHDARLAALPQKPEDVKLDLPADFKLPEGSTFTLDDKDPLVADFRSIVHGAKLSQEDASKLIGLVAQREIAAKTAELEAGKQLFEAETKLLGANAKERRDSVLAFVKGKAGELGGDAVVGEAAVLLTTFAGTVLLENLIKAANGGAIPAPGTGKTTNEPTLAQRMFGDMGFQ